MNSFARIIPAAAALLLGSCTSNPAPSEFLASREKPKLVMLIVVDQLRADLLDRYGDLFTGGFKRLRENGYSYVNATQDHAMTETGPGHATLATGVYPSRHGIVWNDWWEMRDGKWVIVSNVADPGVKIIGEPSLAGVSPKNQLRTGLTEWMVAADPRTIVASVSAKDRGAIQPAAHTKGFVYWFDVSAGKFVTSTWYRAENPAWITSFNNKLERYRADSVWSSTVPQSARTRTNADTLLAEYDGKHTFFPHRFSNEEPPNRFWQWFAYTPNLDAATIELATTMVSELGLGQDDVPDFLNISASATDRVGHRYGPSSREQLDNLLRLDRELGEFFAYVDGNVGKGKWTVMLSADHGVVDMPEDPNPRGEYRHRLTTDEKEMLEALRLQFDTVADKQAGAIRLRDKLKTLPLIGDAWTNDQLDNGQPADSFEVFQRHSRWPGREPGSAPTSLLGKYGREGVAFRFAEGVNVNVTGTNHGSPYFYDRHVPMIFMGPGIPHGRDPYRAKTVDFAPTYARILGIAYPADLDGHALKAVAGN